MNKFFMDDVHSKLPQLFYFRTSNGEAIDCDATTLSLLSLLSLYYVTIWKRECSSQTFFPDNILGICNVFSIIHIILFVSPLTAFLASNLVAKFSRQQIFVQILGMASPKVCGNLALLRFRWICSTMKLLGIFHASNIRETLRIGELDFSSLKILLFWELN
jgi:hypothetical protein